MTDPADRSLEERLHALARGVAAPMVPPDEDVRRGRRRLVRMRVAMAGATTGTLAVVLGITGLTAGDPKATEVPSVTQPPTLLPGTPSSTPSTDGSVDAPPGDHQGRSGGGRRAGGTPDTVGATQGSGDTGVSVGKSQLEHAPTEAASSDVSPHHQPAGPGAGQTLTLDATPTSTPTDAPSGLPTGLPTEGPTGTPTDPGSPRQPPTEPPTDPPTTTPPTQPPPVRGSVQRILAAYNKILAEQLDPARDHLQPYSHRLDPTEVTKSADGLFALGSTYRWAGGHSLAELGLTVATGWDQVDWGCGASYADWGCHLVDSATDRTEVATHDGVRQVAVEHADGQVVVLTADDSIDERETDLVAAASDERLVLPGATPQAPPTIDADAFASAGLAGLVLTDESFDQSSFDRSPWVRGTWSADRAEPGTLAWSARPIYSGGAFTCLTTYRSCRTVLVDGEILDVAQLRRGAWLVQYDGPSYAVRVYSSSRGFPKPRAYAFVTDDAWQPAR